MLKISDLKVTVDGKAILNGLNLEVGPGEVHAIMGPNGSGKSTLANVIAGRDGYEVTGGSVSFMENDLLEMAPEERAREGVFLAFQYPVEIPGVANIALLKEGLNAARRHRGEKELDALEDEYFEARTKADQATEAYAKAIKEEEKVMNGNGTNSEIPIVHPLGNRYHEYLAVP